MPARIPSAEVEVLVIGSAAGIIGSCSIAGVVSIAVTEAGGIGAISRRTVAGGAISSAAVVCEVVSSASCIVVGSNGVVGSRRLVVASVGASVPAVGHLDVLNFV